MDDLQSSEECAFITEEIERIVQTVSKCCGPFDLRLIVDFAGD